MIERFERSAACLCYNMTHTGSIRHSRVWQLFSKGFCHTVEKLDEAVGEGIPAVKVEARSKIFYNCKCKINANISKNIHISENINRCFSYEALNWAFYCSKKCMGKKTPYHKLVYESIQTR